MVMLGTSSDASPPRRLDRSEPIDDYWRQVTDRTRTARSHLDGVLSMLENDGWCPDVMKQLPAAQGLIECTGLEVLRGHLGAHHRAACRDGRVVGVVVELMEALEHDRHVLRATP